MNETPVIAPVRKIVRVKAPIAHAFEVFTGGLARWWPYDYGVGKKPIEKVLMEPRLGGRWLEISEDGSDYQILVEDEDRRHGVSASSLAWR